VTDAILEHVCKSRGNSAVSKGQTEESEAFHAAIVPGHLELPNRLAANPDLVPTEGVEVGLFDAISANSLEIFAHLLVRLCDFRLAESDPVACLAAAASEDLILWLLSLTSVDTSLSLPPAQPPGLALPPDAKGARTLLTKVIDMRADRALDILLKNPAVDLTAADCTGRNALHAALYANGVAVERLMGSPEFHLDLDTPDWDGMTPLMIAVRTKNARAVRWLLERGCKVKPANAAGETAWRLAFEEEPDDRDQYVKQIMLLLLGFWEQESGNIPAGAPDAPPSLTSLPSPPAPPPQPPHPVTCSIPGCGSQEGLGRCATCGRIFCSDHQEDHPCPRSDLDGAGDRDPQGKV
jgi:hypothetical protein